MKKLISALLVILTFTALFASCGQSADTTAPDTSEILPFETNAPDTDDTYEPSGVIALYNTLKCEAKLTLTQNRDHDYSPPISTKYSVSKNK